MLAPNNRYREINSDAFGHPEVAIHGPLLPFNNNGGLNKKY